MFSDNIKGPASLKKSKSSAALQCLKSTFSNIQTNLTIVSSYSLQITYSNENLLWNLRRTKNIKTNASVLKTSFQTN